VNEFGEGQQIIDAKSRSPIGQYHERCRWNEAGPGSGKRSYLIGSLIKGDPIFSPIMTVVEDFKLLAKQGMERMGDGEDSFHK
jgi:hypothetical protein